MASNPQTIWFRVSGVAAIAILLTLQIPALHAEDLEQRQAAAVGESPGLPGIADCGGHAPLVRPVCRAGVPTRAIAFNSSSFSSQDLPDAGGDTRCFEAGLMECARLRGLRMGTAMHCAVGGIRRRLNPNTVVAIIDV